MGRDYPDYQDGPYCDHKRLYKREAERDLTQTESKEADVITEAETRMMWLQTRNAT